MTVPKRNAHINTQDYKEVMEWMVFNHGYILEFWIQDYLSSKSDLETASCGKVP
jgi:hypothetical protein